MDTFPKSDHEALADFLEAIRKRSRALKYKFAVVECERVIELKDREAHERIELRLAERSTRGLRLTLWLWDDRCCWFDARRGAKSGWAFEWSYDGRLVGELAGRGLIEALEKAHELIAVYEGNAEQLTSLWRPLLLRGPHAH